MLTTKLKGFTLSEIIIVLILSSLVVGLGFSVLRIVHKQVSRFNAYNDTKLKLATTETKLNILFHQSQSIYYKEDELYFIKQTDTIKTTFEGNFLQIETDSIDLTPKTIIPYFEGNVTKEGNIDAIELEFELDKNRFSTLFIYKTNDTKSKAKTWE